MGSHRDGRRVPTGLARTIGGTAIAVAVAFAFGAATLSGQAPAAKATGAEAKATPRLADGHPDLNGNWDRTTVAYGSGPLRAAKTEADGKSICLPGTCPENEKEEAARAANGPRPGPARPKYKPEFQAKVKTLSERQIFEDPAFKCRPPGVPRVGPPPRIVQTAHEVVFLYDDLSGNFFRLIPTDGRPHRTDVDASYLGDAVGRWDGDTLVIETTNFNADSWLTDDGSFHTEKLRVTERVRRVGDTLEYQATAEDPDVLAEPFVMPMRRLPLSTFEIAEAPPCVERDGAQMLDLSYHGNPR